MNSTIDHGSQLPDASRAPSAEWTDEDLMLQYQKHGDRRAFDQLVHRYEGELFSYLRRYLGDAHMAEDAFQTTFLQVHLKCDRFEPGRRVRPWLYTVATNQAIDSQRRNKRHRMVSLDRQPGGNGESDVAALIDLFDNEDPGPVKQLEEAELGDEVRSKVEQLPESLRQVVLLVYYQGLKYREAADILSIPVGTVKSRLHCAVQKLGESLTHTGMLEDD